MRVWALSHARQEEANLFKSHERYQNRYRSFQFKFAFILRNAIMNPWIQKHDRQIVISFSLATNLEG